MWFTPHPIYLICMVTDGHLFVLGSTVPSRKIGGRPMPTSIVEVSQWIGIDSCAHSAFDRPFRIWTESDCCVNALESWGLIPLQKYRTLVDTWVGVLWDCVGLHI